MKKITIYLASLMLLFSVSCSSYLDVNNNVDTPDFVDPHLRLGPILSAFENLAWDARAVMPLAQYMGSSVSAWNTFAKNGFPNASDNGGDVWRMVYWLHGFNLELLIEAAEKDKQYTMAGIGYAIKAFSWHTLTNLHGEAPLNDAFVPGLHAHSYNTQEYIYNAVRKWSYKALEYLNKADNTDYAQNLRKYDLVYAGDKGKWIKFVNAVLVRHYLCYSNKADFLSGMNYADSVIVCADRSFASAADDAKVRVLGEVSTNSNFFGVKRPNLSNSFVQSDYAVQLLTGTLPAYNASGDKVGLRSPQITSDASTFDPRACLLMGTASSGSDHKNYVYSGARPGEGSISGITNLFGLTTTVNESNSGIGRWLYRDNAAWPLTTYAEIQLCKAEAAYKKGNKALALAAFQNGVKGHLDFCESYIYNASVGGDKITPAEFRTYANDYIASAFVDGLALADFSLSHVMMQKWIALYPWSLEGWTDLRRHTYDLKLGANGEVVKETSYTSSYVIHKDDNDPSRIYKGFYMTSASVQDRGYQFPSTNDGAPCFRLRPRYNSEYKWNVAALESLTPIKGTADNYHTSVIWFAKP